MYFLNQLSLQVTHQANTHSSRNSGCTYTPRKKAHLYFFPFCLGDHGWCFSWTKIREDKIMWGLISASGSNSSLYRIFAKAEHLFCLLYSSFGQHELRTPPFAAQTYSDIPANQRLQTVPVPEFSRSWGFLDSRGVNTGQLWKLLYNYILPCYFKNLSTSSDNQISQPNQSSLAIRTC